MNYGIGIQGSKNKLAERIIATLPPATHLYEPFCGGGGITHCALMSGKWRHIHFSDVSDTVYCVRDFLEGNLPDGSEWVSREDFYARKDTEPWIRILWSFARNQRDYIYSRKIEPYKKAVHEMIYAETPNERRLKFKEVCRLMAQTRENRPEDLAHAERLQRVEQQAITPPEDWIYSSTSRTTGDSCKGTAHGTALPPPPHKELEISRLESAERCREASSVRPFLRGEYDCRVCDYREVDILPDSIVYADPPYIGTREYRHDDFDHGAFYDWCESLEVPVFISEYFMPPERFKPIAEWERTSTFSATNNGLKRIERLYVPNRWYDRFRPTEQTSLFDDI